MKKIFVSLVLLSAIVIGGCSSTGGSATKTISDSTAQTYVAMASSYASDMCSSMSSWGSLGSIGALSVGKKQVGIRSLPIVNGWYHLATTESFGGIDIDCDIYARLVPATGKPTEIDVYGPFSISGNSYSLSITYGNGASDPYKGTLTWAGSNLTGIAVNGRAVVACTVPAGSGTGTDSIELAINYSNLSVSFALGGAVASYPSGTVTIGMKYNGATQPDMVVTFNGTSVASWSFGGTTGTINISPIYAASVPK
jgi:hypothetical protein